MSNWNTLDRTHYLFCYEHLPEWSESEWLVWSTVEYDIADVVQQHRNIRESERHRSFRLYEYVPEHGYREVPIPEVSGD